MEKKLSKKLSDYMQFKKDVAERAPQLKKDVEAIRALLRDKYGFGDKADEFRMGETAHRGYRDTGKYGSFNSKDPFVSMCFILPSVRGGISDSSRGVHITVSSGGYFIIGMKGHFKVRAVEEKGSVLACIDLCQDFISDIRAINPRYLGE